MIAMIIPKIKTQSKVCTNLITRIGIKYEEDKQENNKEKAIIAKSGIRK